MTQRPQPIHPGEILVSEFMQPLGLSQTELAAAIGVPPRRLEQVIAGKRPVSADLDLRLARFLALPEGFFLRMQLEHDLDLARDRLGKRLAAEIRPRAA